MKKILVVTVLLTTLFAIQTANGKDIILKNDCSEIKAIVFEIIDTQIKYKDLDFQDGQTRNILKTQVFQITYENGKNEIFTKPVSPVNREATQPSQSSTRTIYAEVALQNEKLRVALIDITSISITSWWDIEAAKELTSLLTTELVKTNRFRVMERSKIQEILNEQGLQETQAAGAQAVKIGRLLGIHKIITGEYISRVGVNHGHTTIRFIDVETGDIEAAITIDNMIRNKNGNFVRTMNNEEIAKKLVEELFKNIE